MIAHDKIDWNAIPGDLLPDAMESFTKVALRQAVEADMLWRERHGLRVALWHAVKAAGGSVTIPAHFIGQALYDQPTLEYERNEMDDTLVIRALERRVDDDR